jgi:segregation and condensation protein B
MELKFILESILFTAQKPLSPAELREVLSAAAAAGESPDARVFKSTKAAEIERALEGLACDHEDAARAYRLVCVAGAWQFVTQPEYAPWVKAMVGERSRPSRLSQPALETLAIVAYRQPLTRTEIEQIRGVSVDGVMQTLLERGLLAAVGRAEVVGRPVTYGTTALFLEYFGLRALEDLPAADELRRIPVERPEQLVTADPSAARTPEQLTLGAIERPATGPAESTGTTEKPAPSGSGNGTLETPGPTAPHSPKV